MRLGPLRHCMAMRRYSIARYTIMSLSPRAVWFGYASLSRRCMCIGMRLCMRWLGAGLIRNPPALIVCRGRRTAEEGGEGGEGVGTERGGKRRGRLISSPGCRRYYRETMRRMHQPLPAPGAIIAGVDSARRLESNRQEERRKGRREERIGEGLWRE